jgi:hypothetical protein
MSATSMTSEQFFASLAQTFRDRAQAALGSPAAPVAAWSTAVLQQIATALNTIPGGAAAISANCPGGGNQMGQCTYTVDGNTFSVRMTCAQCQGIPGGTFHPG